MGVSWTEDEVAARCHANCIEYAREGARGSGAEGQLVEHDGVVLFAGGSDFPVLANGAFRVDPSVPAAAVVERADAWFAERGRGWSIGTTSWRGADEDLIEAALARGLLTVTDQPAMVCDERLPDALPPEGIELRVLTTADETRAFVAMADQARVLTTAAETRASVATADQAHTSLRLPAGIIPAMAGPTPRIPPPHLVTVGAFDGDELVSGAQVLFSHGIAGVYCVGTTESARGRGLAELVTRTVTNLGFDGGAPVVTLQASSMGEPIYRRMGYRDLYRYATHARFV